MSTSPDFASAWAQVITNAPSEQQRAWLRRTAPLTLHQNRAIVAVPDSFTGTQIETRLRQHIESTLTEQFGRPTQLAITVDNSME